MVKNSLYLETMQDVTSVTQWAGVISDSFAICNGVRQGGILSLFLFGIYIDELSSQLQSKHRMSNE